MKHPSLISISEFTYDLPPEKIANYPLAKRDESKLLIFKNGQISEDRFKHLSDFLENGSILVFNITKVIHARLNVKNAKGKAIEVFCLEPANHVDISVAMSAQKTTRWNCLVGNLKQWREETLVFYKNELEVRLKIVERRENFVIVDFYWDVAGLSFAEVLDRIGAMPIPPYLKRESEKIDAERYQTIYAKQKGSVAAPTAGLHFTEAVLAALKKKAIKSLDVTLHVGAGTFKPVKSALMQQHEMHAEWIEVEGEVIKALISSAEKNIIPIGTTSLRAIESLYWMGFKTVLNPDITIDDLEVKQWDPYDLPGDRPDIQTSLSALLLWMKRKDLGKMLCQTSILIAPQYELKICKGILTNFHQPQSTLLLLISAIIGEKWKEVYDYALKNKFRFLSYGDSSLLLK